MSKIKLSKKYIYKICKEALKEDLYPSGDITSKLLNNTNKIKAKIVSNSSGIIGGLDLAKQTFKIVDKKILFKIKKKEGSKIKNKQVIAEIVGNVKNILTGERVALNFLSHISGIATQTNKFVDKVKKNTKICCTRKTIPGLRAIQKYAVNLGGGYNHRFNLSDEFLIKDNHIANTNIRELIIKAKKNKKKITVEIDSLNQLKKILDLKFDTILFDNMNVRNLKKGVRLVKNKYETEASGNVNLKNIRKIASTGINRISIGRLTHSVSAIDLKLEI
ncbi:carboxylating nicotinate-nucleotide diphosphorylase [Candidatus Pelagibacter sp.]|nr:carboxylating nicotinate-nucleotide diphosphorylase [Candidatus Pelagibacter sp.]